MVQDVYKTEFFESAVKMGFYGLDRGGLLGKKDNVRKYWEDLFTKLFVLPALCQLRKTRDQLRIVDMGCGSGEGFELLTHVPYVPHHEPPRSGFLLWRGDIRQYVGLDISPAMIEQGCENYKGHDNVMFRQHDLSQGFPLLTDEPFDFYFSSYSSMSHLTEAQLQTLAEQIFKHASPGACVLFDMLGRYSPEWPTYWGRSNKEMLPYNMAYLLPPESRSPQNIEWYQLSYWTAAELRELVRQAANRIGRKINVHVADRSILIGRHMETGQFGANIQMLRSQVNRLFDRDYRGEVSQLRVDIGRIRGLSELPAEVTQRVARYCDYWNRIVNLLEALMHSRNNLVQHSIESAQAEVPELTEDMKMLTWLYRSSSRFPVADFWASVMGPQVACVLRNLEMNLGEGLGCGHGLLAMVQLD